MDSQGIAPPQPQKKDISMGTFLVGVLVLACIVLSALGFTSYYFYGPCGIKRVQSGGIALADHFDSFYQVHNVALQTPRYALDEAIYKMQKVKQSTQLVTVPACMEGAQNELVLAIDSEIQALQFFSMDNDIGVQMFLDESAGHLAEFQTQLELVEKCKPFCTTR